MPKKKPQRKKKHQIDVTLKLNVEVGQSRATDRKSKVIRSRKRTNLRTMRNGMGGLTAANLKQPSFFGNTALLTNSAMAAMNNKAYALERQMLDQKAESQAQIAAGRDVNPQSQALIEGLQREVTLTRALGQAAHQHGQQQVGDRQQQVQQAGAEVQQLKAKARAADATDEELKSLAAEVLGQGWSPGGIKAGKFKEIRPTLQGLYADRDNADLRRQLEQSMSATHRAKSLRKPAADQGPSRTSSELALKEVKEAEQAQLRAVQESALADIERSRSNVSQSDLDGPDRTGSNVSADFATPTRNSSPTASPEQQRGGLLAGFFGGGGTYG